MRPGFYLFCLLALGACSSRQKCHRIYQRHPECFAAQRDTVRDTAEIILERLDTSFILDLDTIRIPGPCGEISITRDSSGRTRVQIPRAQAKVPRTTIRERLPAPAPCDCEKLTQALREERKKQRGTVWPWIALGAVLGWIVARRAG